MRALDALDAQVSSPGSITRTFPSTLFSCTIAFTLLLESSKQRYYFPVLRRVRAIVFGLPLFRCAKAEATRVNLEACNLQRHRWI